MKKVRTLMVLALVAVMAISVSVIFAGCGETSTVIEAENASLKCSDEGMMANSVVTDGDVKYVRLNWAWGPTDPAFELTFTFTADQAADATLAFRVAAPIVDGSSGNLGSVLSAMYTLSVNDKAVDVTAWDDAMGTVYDVTAEALTWVTVETEVELVEGENTVTIKTVEKSGNYGDYVWHCTDSPCFDNLTITTSAAITVA